MSPTRLQHLELSFLHVCTTKALETELGMTRFSPDRPFNGRSIYRSDVSILVGYIQIKV